MEEPVEQRLKSRRTWDETFESVRNLSVNEEWKFAWETGPVVNSHLVLDPTVKVPGFNLKGKHGKIWIVCVQTAVDVTIVYINGASLIQQIAP